MKVVIRNTNNGQMTGCKDLDHAKRILKIIVKKYGKEELKGIFVDLEAKELV